MNELKDCRNCKSLRELEDKFQCGKGHFTEVKPQDFFYDPDAPKKFDPRSLAREPNIFWLNKYKAISNAINCDEYDSKEMVLIDDIKFIKPEEKKYESIIISAKWMSNLSKTILLENISSGSKIYKWAKWMKNYLDDMKEFSGNLGKA